ncbi:hypothetical protein V1264_006799 [Littorina saxatilis]|uniref:Chitin-binding type-2 domain-containing protein n=1 Tax=Littorina saxatilis TaxID=31220 RepID=A0AAN9AYI6_9CAEN
MRVMLTLALVALCAIFLAQAASYNLTDGGWTDWSRWKTTTMCTVLCGGGVKNETRDRSCTNPEPSKGGSACVGEDRTERTVNCNTKECGDLCPEGEDTYIAVCNPRYFYQCQQGQEGVVSTKAFLKKCPEETVWNQTSTTCVHKPSGDTTPPLAPEPETAPTCTEGASRADPDDCTYYLQCVNGSEMKRPCPAGTKFDNALGYCNHANHVDC